MRKLSKLVQKKERIWIYLADCQAIKDFAAQCQEEEFRFLDGAKLTAEKCSHVMSIHQDGTLNHVAIWMWSMSFRCQVGNTPIRIDYEKFRDGAEDFLCQESYFKRVR